MKKIFIGTIIAFIICFNVTYHVKALSQSNYINRDDSVTHLPIKLTCGRQCSWRPMNTSGSFYTPFNNLGSVEGNLIFSFAIDANDVANQAAPYSVEIESDGLYQCDIGNILAYNDTEKQLVVITANCPVKFNSSNGLKQILFNRSQSPTIMITPSYIATFVSKNDVNVSTNVDVHQQDVVNAISASQQSLISGIQQSNQAVIDAAHQDAQQAHQDAQQIDNTLKDDNVNQSESAADDLKNNSAFQDNSGLSSIISMPLTFVNNLGNTCQPISLTIPYMDYTFQIPCMQQVVNNYMPSLVIVIKIVVNGLLIYWVMLDIFKIVKNAKNPEDDRIEVLDL